MVKEAPFASSANRFKRARLPVLLSAALATFGAAHAQTDTSAPGAETQTVERLTITGSNIRRSDTETPSPVQVITSEDLKNSGYTTVAQVLQSITANGQGTLSQGFPQAFAAGASGISLFGLTTAATLVLIDGHRMAPYPLSDDGQRSFVDISNIPFDAVERIEVLKDGASAVYGSDAIAGVVNVILKKSFVGTTVTAETGTTTEGGGQTNHASLMHGWGDFDADGYNAYFGVEYRHQNDITYDQRSGAGQWSSTNLSGIGGLDRTPGAVTPTNPQPPTLGTVYLTNPALTYGAPGSYYFYPGPCTYVLQQEEKCQFQNNHEEIEPQTQNINLIASFTKNLGGDWKLDLKASLFDSQAEQYQPSAFSGGLQTYPSSFSPLVAVSAGVNPYLVGTSISAITVPANYPGNKLGVPAIVNGVIPGSPAPHSEIDSKATRLVADLSGSILGWDTETAIGYTHVETEQDIYGSINVPLLNELLNSPTNPFKITGNNSSAVLHAVFPETGADDNSYLTFAEFHASRSLLQLPGGDLGFSTGASYTDRSLHSPAPNLIADGLVSGNNAYVSGSQDDTSFYAELAAPVIKSLELDLDARYDHFNDAGDATTGKFGFKWEPSPIIALRGTIGTGFRAPNAAENGQSGQAYLFNSTNDPILCPGGVPATGNIAKGSVINTCTFEPVYLNSSNPDVKPEKSSSRTIGFILEPIKGWSTTVDLYDINIRDQIVAGSGDINAAVRGSPVASLCANGTGGTYTCIPSVGPILYIPVKYINANSTSTSGIQFDSGYKWNLGEYGTLKTDLSWNHTMGYILTVDAVHYQLAGTHGPFIIGGDTGNPRDRIKAIFDWERGPWGVTTTVNYISSYNLTDPSQGQTNCAIAAADSDGWFPSNPPPSSYCNVKSFVDTDVSVRYKLDKQWTIFGAIDNIFNQQPPVDIATYGAGQLPYNSSFHLAGAVGRFINIGANYKF
jgi:iron complex outermembrane receptor protein